MMLLPIKVVDAGLPFEVACISAIACWNIFCESDSRSNEGSSP